MSRGFDEAVQASWGRFEDRLMSVVKEIGDGSFEVDVPRESDADGLLPYLWLGVHGDRIRVELCAESSDDALTLDLNQENALAAIGWHLPSDPDHLSWWFEAVPAEAELLRSMVTETLRMVFGIVHPRFLESDRLWPTTGVEATEEIEAAEEGGELESDPAPTMGFPENVKELVGMVEETLKRYDGPDIVRDDDGDFSINTGVVPLWVRVLDHGPIVRLYSYVVRSVRDIRQARIEVDILNRRTDLLKFHVADGVITASYDLSAVPFIGPQLLHALDRATELLNDLAEDAALRVGGKLWFDKFEDEASTDLEESA
jgi:hypothetical protein